jgi:small subunit ribosomal protein S17
MTDRARRKSRVGVVVSDGRDKTITVEVTESVLHSKYTKKVSRHTRLHAHDEANDANVGDTVRVEETRPLSKTKRWRMAEIVERAQ